MVFTSSGTWTKPDLLFAIEVCVRAAGGSGATGIVHATTTQRLPGPGGGGGAAVRSPRRILAHELADTVAITVGAGGAAPTTPGTANGAWNPGNNGGLSSFGDRLTATGGFGGGWQPQLLIASSTVGGFGGWAPYRGGIGGASGAAGETVSLHDVDLLAGGGGGGSGSGYVGGVALPAYGAGGGSGLVLPGTSSPTYWQWTQSGGGGHGGGFSTAAQAGGFPSGGGGGGEGGGQLGAAGGAGCVSVMELLYPLP